MTNPPTDSLVIISGGGRRYHRIEDCYYFQLGRQKVRNRNGILAKIERVGQKEAAQSERYPCEWCVVRGLGATRSQGDDVVVRQVGPYAKLDAKLERVVQERSLGKNFDAVYNTVDKSRKWRALMDAVGNSSDAIRYWILGFTPSMAERWAENDLGLCFAIDLADTYGMTGQLIGRWLNGGAKSDELPKRRPGRYS